jgi:hypothetical protein
MKDSNDSKGTLHYFLYNIIDNKKHKAKGLYYSSLIENNLKLKEIDIIHNMSV